MRAPLMDRVRAGARSGAAADCFSTAAVTIEDSRQAVAYSRCPAPTGSADACPLDTLYATRRLGPVL